MTKIEPGSIVIGTDGSPDAARAVAWATEQAALERRPLVVVSAAREVPALVAAGPGATYTFPTEEILESARAIADEAVTLAKGHRPGVTVSGLAALGDPRTVLVDLTHEAHLLVLGSRGRGPLGSKLLGSVGAAVSKHASCPVVVCRPGPDGARTRGVAVGADGTAESLPVVDFAFRQAALHSLPLSVVHCFWDVRASVDDPAIASADEPGVDEQQLLLAESVAGFRERYPEVDVTLTTARGSADDCLSALADAHDLVVVGRHPVHGVARRLMGAVSTSVLERSHTTVAVVPEAEPGESGDS